MTTIRSTTAAAACAAVLAGLGIGWANDAPQPPPPPAAVQSDPPRIPAPAAKDAPTAAGPHVHKTANFEVTAPTATMARALGEAYERQRSKSAAAWSGADLPAWKEPVPVRVRALPPGPSPYQVDVRGRVPGDNDFLDGALGTQEVFVSWHAPVLADRLVVRTLIGRRPPWWAEGALDWIANPNSPPTFWTSSVVPVRRQLEAGEARRLAALFGVTQQAGGSDAQTQGTTVVGFLLSRTADPRPGRPLTAAEVRRTLLRFLTAGGDSGWERAAKDVYGFASLAEMERAWIDWVRAEPGPAADPDRIPPQAPAAAPAARPAVSNTSNFVVTAPTIRMAEGIAVAAERHRRELATRWLGKELPAAKEPLPVTVTINAGAAGGATTFTFGAADGKTPPGVTSAVMELHGPLNQLVASNVPHEVMHVVLATHFGRPLPRWADEGIAVLAESDAEQKNHDIRARELLNAGRAIRLGTLFRMTEYPRDMIVLYAQGCSVCRFLLARGAADPHPGGPPGVRAHKTVRYANDAHEVRFAKGDREPALLAFLALGMYENTAESWATAAKEVYGFNSLDALEQAWIDALRPGAGPAP